MQWYYSKNSTQLGPVSDAELLTKLASGEVLRTDMVWREGMPDWVAASTVPELAVPVPGVTQEAPALRQSGGNAPASPYASPVASQYAPGILIPNYLWQSIVVTIFCCWPCGIPAIVYAAKVDGLKMSGNINGAMEASANAKKWCFISLFSWIGIMVLYGIFAAFMVASQH